MLTASHGDDLLYLFELQTLEGKPIPGANLKNVNDLKVKEVFVNVVSEFLHNGYVLKFSNLIQMSPVLISNFKCIRFMYKSLLLLLFRKPRIPGSKDEWPPYRNENSYAVISHQPRIEKKFRYCQVALWGGLVKKLTDPFCNFPGIDSVLKLLPHNLLDQGLTGSLGKVLSTEEGILNGGQNFLNNKINGMENVHVTTTDNKVKLPFIGKPDSNNKTLRLPLLG